MNCNHDNHILILTVVKSLNLYFADVNAGFHHNLVRALWHLLVSEEDHGFVLSHGLWLKVDSELVVLGVSGLDGHV